MFSRLQLTAAAILLLLLAAYTCAGLPQPGSLTALPWSATHKSRWYSLDSGIDDLMIEGTTSTVLARQISTGNITQVWITFDGEDYRILDGSGGSGTTNPLTLYSFLAQGFFGTREVTTLNIKTLAGSALAPTWSNTDYTLPTVPQSRWKPMLSVDGVVYFYSGRYLIGIRASDGTLVTNMTLATSDYEITSNARAAGHAYPDGAKFLTFPMSSIYETKYHQVVVDLRRNTVVGACVGSQLTSTPYSSQIYPTFAPAYSSSNSGGTTTMMYPMIFAWGSSFDDTPYTYASAANASTGDGTFGSSSSSSSCSPIWSRTTSTVNIPTISVQGITRFQRPGDPFTFVDTTHAIYTSFVGGSYDDGRLVWLNYRTGTVTKNILVDGSISSFHQDQCSSTAMVGPSVVGTTMDLILSFDMYLYQYASSSSATSSTSYAWRMYYGNLFSSSADVDDAGCAAWRYKTVGGKSLFITNSGNADMAAMAATPATQGPTTTTTTASPTTSGSPGGTFPPSFLTTLAPRLTSSNPTSSSEASSSSSYSPYYRVSLTSGLTGSSAKTSIESALFSRYGLTSSSLTGWYYEGSYVTFRIYAGLSWSLTENRAKSGLFDAQTNSTLRDQLGFASCAQTESPNYGAAVAAAFGTLFIVLILIGVALVICVVAIIICCCCCTAKAVANQQADYVPMNQLVPQPGYAQHGGGQMVQPPAEML